MHDHPKHRKLTLMLLAAAILTSGLASCNEGSSSEDPAGPGRGGGGGGQLRIACQQDIDQLCAKEEHPRQCLTGHANALSRSCKDALDDRGSRK